MPYYCNTCKNIVSSSICSGCQERSISFCEPILPPNWCYLESYSKFKILMQKVTMFFDLELFAEISDTILVKDLAHFRVVSLDKKTTLQAQISEMVFFVKTLISFCFAKYTYTETDYKIIAELVLELIDLTPTENDNKDADEKVKASKGDCGLIYILTFLFKNNILFLFYSILKFN